jgi:hypothetical protein
MQDGKGTERGLPSEMRDEELTLLELLERRGAVLAQDVMAADLQVGDVFSADGYVVAALVPVDRLIGFGAAVAVYSVRGESLRFAYLSPGRLCSVWRAEDRCTCEMKDPRPDGLCGYCLEVIEV